MAAKLTQRSDIQRKFGQAVRAYRMTKHITQEQLAERAGLHVNYVGSVERGERNVSIRNIEKLAKALGVKIIDLFEGAHSVIPGRVRPTRLPR